MAKKMTESVTYNKGTEITDKTQMCTILDRSIVTYVKQQKMYDDGTQSVTIEIHFKPTDKNNL